MIDLHTHSTKSDGSQTPKQLVLQAHQKKLKLFSITDHDSIDAVAEGLLEASKVGLKFISGTELSVIYRHPLYKNGQKGFELHLLGYGFDHTNKTLVHELSKNQKHREWRAGEIYSRLNAALHQDGESIIAEAEFAAMKQSIDGAIGRPHLAAVLLQKGIVTGMQEAFDRYLKKCDVAKRDLLLETAAELIRSAGGKLVVAHPNGLGAYSFRKISSDFNVHFAILDSMRDHIDGVECFYWDHTPQESEQYAAFAKSLGMIVTGGTDHHGNLSGDAERDRLGTLAVPEYVLDFF
ncbi:PHP domain-containing protein [Candidatus Woesearchaeota archaeon]|nr:PHP domain-containing protein [Candidatus Woesearchaeota archaeon]